MLLTPAEIKPKSFDSRRNSFFTRGGCVSCLRACFGARLLPQSYLYPTNLSEGADSVGGQLRGDKECPFSGVTKSGRVWRKVPESDDRRVQQSLTLPSFLLTVCATLRAPLSGTFLQTLPDLVTPLKGHSLSPRSCPATRSAPSSK